MMIAGGFGVIVGAVSMLLTMPFILVLSILKIFGACSADWFAWPATLSAIGTPVWLAVGGFILIVVSSVVMEVVEGLR